MKNKKYYLGLDIGSDSVGYAVTDEEYNLLKLHGEPAWGATLFDAPASKAERRGYRTARRRLERRKQRVQLVRELFAEEIAKVDGRFYIRQQESALFREDAGDAYSIFNDPDYTDREYYAEYPTIHHLIFELMKNPAPHDVRLVYLACAWLVAHRGHFLSNISKDNMDSFRDFNLVYKSFISFFTDNGYDVPWNECDEKELGNILKKKIRVTDKKKELTDLLYGGKKPSSEATEDFPFSRAAIIGLFAGSKVRPKDLFQNSDYENLEGITLDMDDEKFINLSTELGDDYELIAAMRAVYDWTVLADILGNYSCISEAKAAVYEQHRKDLRFLKDVIAKYRPEKYSEVFRAADKDNYVAYAYHTDEVSGSNLKRKDKEAFSKYILGIVKNISPDASDKQNFDDMITRLEDRTFMPKQKDGDNRVIPQQLYAYELDAILKNATQYLPFLNETDEDGLSVADKISSVFSFRVPYFVGPLNSNSPRAWLARKSGKIYPWNFEKMVDLDASEQNFIEQLTNTCTYIPGEPVLPKDSLLYHKFSVLNEINNLCINEKRISVELKQEIYNSVFMCRRKVTRKQLISYLVANGYVEKGKEDTVTGVDININSNLAPQISFKRLIESRVLSEQDVERIIERASYSEDKTRLAAWLKREYPNVNDADRKYICSLRIHDFGRLSRRFLSGVEGVRKETGEVMTVISALWETQYNLMEIVADADRFTFKDELKTIRDDYYSEHPQTLDSRLDDMYVSDAVRRPIHRTLDIIKDVVKAFGEPEKIFVETTRDASGKKKGERTTSRKEQILKLYKKCGSEDVRLLQEQLEAMGEAANTKLQSEKLFLYYMQLGRCMYTNQPIKLEALGTKLYDIDHIYPQCFVKDDSIINNKVLVLSEANGAKGNVYPINSDIRKKMHGIWESYKAHGLISEEKFKRLTRTTPFTEEEKYNFINRQLTETSQSTKAVATLLNEFYPDTEIVYSKAEPVSDFRKEFEIYKSRLFNDLHHAVDAYLNIVVGNVYHMKFTRRWFNVNSDYSMKAKTIFTHPVICGGQTVWDGAHMLEKAKTTAAKNNAHITKFATFKNGGLFDQNPISAKEGLTPLKKGLPTEKYGGYNKAGSMFFIPVRYRVGKKTDIIIMPVELLCGKKFLEDAAFAKEYTFDRLGRLLKKTVDEFSFPLGMRPWKVNTVLSLDGFRVCISGGKGGGTQLITQTLTQFAASKDWAFYLKKLEEFNKKNSKNPNYIYDEKYDKISAEKNLELYDLYIDKLENSIFSKRVNCPTELLKKGRNKFIALGIKEQSQALLNIHQVFGRISRGCDLSAVGGTSRSAATESLSTKISNWKKDYKDVRIIDSSASGLWEKRSCNLLDLL